MAEQPCEGGGQHDPQRRKKDGGDRHRLGLLPFGAEPSVEHDEDEGDRAELFRKGIVAEFNFDDSVDAKEHPEQDEGQQRRNAELT